eukprot:4529455-Amphidinium_carterae.1
MSEKGDISPPKQTRYPSCRRECSGSLPEQTTLHAQTKRSSSEYGVNTNGVVSLPLKRADSKGSGITSLNKGDE